MNNAGIEIKKPVLEVSDDEWNRVLNVNVFGAFVVSQCAAKQMVAQNKSGEIQGGKLIFISSVHEDIPFPEYSAYAPAKARRAC